MTRAKEITKEAKKFAKEIDDWEIAEDVQDAFEQGARWADAHPHWISVEDDGNPIDTGWYIFTTGKIVDVGYYLGGNEWRDVHPTHWMPLPQAPTVAKNATVK